MALVLDKRLTLCCCAFSTISVANAATVNGTSQVLMTVQKACTMTAGSASNTILDPMNTMATNTSASSTTSINCSKTTPHSVGLASSVANGGTTTDSGAMSSIANVTTNTDKVPYWLNRTSATDPVWGNTATDTAPGNRVAATGTGLAQTYTVYATALSVNLTPDDHADTVTVNVNYQLLGAI